MTEEQRAWVERAVNNQNIWWISEKKKDYLTRLVEESQGLCRWTKLPLKFDRDSAYIHRHDLAAEIDHREPGENCEGHDIVCHYINQMKNRLPWKVWQALTVTPEFEQWMAKLRANYERTGTLAPPAAPSTGA